MEGPGQIIDCAERNETEGGRALHRGHTIDGFIDGSIAAHADDIPFRPGRFPGKSGGITRFFRDFHVHFFEPFLQDFLQQGKILRRPFMPRRGVHDDGALPFFFHE